MPRKVFVAGEILTAADVNTNLMDQAVMSFAGTAARGSAIPTPTEGMVTYLQDSDTWEGYTTSWGPLASGFTASTAITATDASWSVPALAFPIVKVTAIGGGGGGASFASSDGSGANGGNGGTTTFNAGGAGTVTATGGFGGRVTTVETAVTNQASGNRGSNGLSSGGSFGAFMPPAGGNITEAYLDLTGVSTVNVTIGGGGTKDTSKNLQGSDGARGEVIVEYVAG